MASTSAGSTPAHGTGYGISLTTSAGVILFLIIGTHSQNKKDKFLIFTTQDSTMRGQASQPMNDIKAGIFREKPREIKPYDPFEETKQIVEEFNRLAGADAIWNPKVFGLRLDGNKVSLTYEGRDYIWMELNKPNVSMSRNTPQWMMTLADKCNNVFDIAKVFGPLVLSESNITRARTPQSTESEDQRQSVLQSKGPKMH